MGDPKVESQENDGASNESDADGGPIDWTILKSIQEANAASMRAMEEYLMFAIGPETLGDPARTQALLECCRDDYRRAIDQIELAIDQIDRRPAVEMSLRSSTGSSSRGVDERSDPSSECDTSSNTVGRN